MNATSLSLSLVLLTAAGTLAGCATSSPTAATTAPASPASSTNVRPAISDRLYFGQAIPAGGMVSEVDWKTFVAEVITPRFSAGLTGWHAEGQWKDASGQIIREPSYVLELIHPYDAASEKAIAEIIAEYRKRFSQDSVMRVHDKVEVSF